MVFKIAVIFKKIKGFSKKTLKIKKLLTNIYLLW